MLLICGCRNICAVCLAEILSRKKFGVGFSWFAQCLLCVWNARVQGGFVNISRNSKHWAGEDVNQETLLV